MAVETLHSILKFSFIFCSGLFGTLFITPNLFERHIQLVIVKIAFAIVCRHQVITNAIIRT